MTDTYCKIDAMQAYMMGQLIKGVALPTLSHPLCDERTWQIWVELVFISICHQTNWDLLHDRIIEIASKDLKSLSPSSLEDMDTNRFQSLFVPGLDKSSAQDSSHRLRLLRSLGKYMNVWPNSSASWLGQHPLLLEGEEGLYRWLEQIPGFGEDPMQKKSRVLVHQLIRYGLVEIADPDNVRPGIDHHIIRSYLRTGRVVPIKAEYITPLFTGETRRVEFITHLRHAVEQAMWYSAAGADLQMGDLNHIEWQIARSFCVKRKARCTSPPLPEKPLDVPIANLAVKTGGSCPWYNLCYGARDPKLRKLVDPRSARSYY